MTVAVKISAWFAKRLNNWMIQCGSNVIYVIHGCMYPAYQTIMIMTKDLSHVMGLSFIVIFVLHSHDFNQPHAFVLII